MLIANAALVGTGLGGGNYGHLALVVSNATYHQTAGVDFPPLVNPGPTPVPPRPFMTNAEIELLHEHHCIEQKQYTLYHNTDKALKQQ
eukprot:2108904-Ditylum_brightwellii.AAC.1